MIVALYSILHFLVDAACAFAMFHQFLYGDYGYLNILIYNFCAFALQMPFGVMLDLLMMKAARYNKIANVNFSFVMALFGVVFTMAGLISSPAILGIGNALFHVGGGVSVIHEDSARNWKGSALGIYVAPGALGLYLGTQLAKMGSSLLIVAMLLVVLFVVLLYIVWKFSRPIEKQVILKQQNKVDKNIIAVVICCFIVVILRSYIGMAVKFPWKTTTYMGVISVLAVVLGKIAGGIISARFGIRRAIVVSFCLSVVGFMFSEQALWGIVALFFFNMTMPITLYLMVCKLKTLPGFSFGLLCFGLFLGFLPVYFQIDWAINSYVLGVLGCVVSMVVLLKAEKL